MFGLSTELITKGKLATVKRFKCFCFERSVCPSSKLSKELWVLCGLKATLLVGA